jgi:hypothetical protein
MPIDSESETFDHVLGRAGELDRLFLPIQELFPPADNGARWRFRTSDPYRVKVVLYP